MKVLRRRSRRSVAKAVRTSVLMALGAAVVMLQTGCKPGVSDRLQGYLEGEYVYIACPLGGAVERLHVERGDLARAGDPLFTLDSSVERAARDEAERRLIQARATLEDARKGKRPSEIGALDASLKQAQAALELAEKELARQQTLWQAGATEIGRASCRERV